MKNYKLFGFSLAFAIALTLFAAPVRAQVAEAAAATVVAPIVTKIVNKIMPQGKPEGSNWLKAEVVHADSQTIIVRERQNGMMIHTFNFSPEMKDKMQAILDNGGFQYGDRVSILFMPGQTVALRIHGKPSKSL